MDLKSLAMLSQIGGRAYFTSEHERGVAFGTVHKKEKEREKGQVELFLAVGPCE